MKVIIVSISGTVSRKTLATYWAYPGSFLRIILAHYYLEIFLLGIGKVQNCALLYSYIIAVNGKEVKGNGRHTESAAPDASIIRMFAYISN